MELNHSMNADNVLVGFSLLEEDLKKHVAAAPDHCLQSRDLHDVLMKFDDSAVCLWDGHLDMLGCTPQFASMYCAESCDPTWQSCEDDVSNLAICLSRTTNEMLMHGATKIEYCHSFESPNMGHIDIRTVKFPIRHESSEVLVIAEISHAISDVTSRDSADSDKALFQRVENLLSLRECEREIIPLLCNGYGNKQIAAKLHTPLRTVENRRRRILRRIGVGSLAELVKVVVRLEDAGLTQFQV